MKCELCGDFHNTYIWKVEAIENFKGENKTCWKRKYYCQKSEMCYIAKDLKKLNTLSIAYAYHIKPEYFNRKLNVNVSAKDKISLAYFLSLYRLSN